MPHPVVSGTQYYLARNLNEALAAVLMSLKEPFWSHPITVQHLKHFDEEKGAYGALQRMLGKSLSELSPLLDYNEPLVARFIKGFTKKELEQIVKETADKLPVAIHYTKVGYKKGVHLTLQKHHDYTKSLYCIIEAVNGHMSDETLICYYEFEGSQQKSAVRPKQAEVINGRPRVSSADE